METLALVYELSERFDRAGSRLTAERSLPAEASSRGMRN
jgi:hypothetical protein